MTALDRYFADYGAVHATPGNRACHWVGIPLIVLTLLALLAQAPLFSLGGFTLTAAETLLLVAAAFYLTLDVPLGLAALAVALALDAAARFVPWPLALALFVFGWVLQFVGHYVYEKKSPALFRNLVHTLVGPLWLTAKALGRA